MRGSDERTGELFSYIDIEERVPENHPLRLIRLLVNEVLAALDREFAQLYAEDGRPSIAPERLLRALLLQAFYTMIHRDQDAESPNPAPNKLGSAKALSIVMAELKFQNYLSLAFDIIDSESDVFFGGCKVQLDRSPVHIPAQHQSGLSRSNTPHGISRKPGVMATLSTARLQSRRGAQREKVPAGGAAGHGCCTGST